MYFMFHYMWTIPRQIIFWENFTRSWVCERTPLPVVGTKSQLFLKHNAMWLPWGTGSIKPSVPSWPFITSGKLKIVRRRQFGHFRERAAGNICVSRACHISRGGTRPDVTRVPQKKSRNAWQQRCWPGYRFKTLFILQIQCNHITRCELVAKKTRKTR